MRITSERSSLVQGKSARDVAELLAQRGIVISYETVRQWCLKFGQTYANELRRRPHCGDKWHLDAAFLTIRGERRDLWRAVDQDGNVHPRAGFLRSLGLSENVLDFLSVA